MMEAVGREEVEKVKELTRGNPIVQEAIRQYFDDPEEAYRRLARLYMKSPDLLERALKASHPFLAYFAMLEEEERREFCRQVMGSLLGHVLDIILMLRRELSGVDARTLKGKIALLRKRGALERVYAKLTQLGREVEEKRIYVQTAFLYCLKQWARNEVFIPFFNRLSQGG